MRLENDWGRCATPGLHDEAAPVGVDPSPDPWTGRAADRRGDHDAIDPEWPVVELELAHPLETLARRPRRHAPRWKPTVTGTAPTRRSVREGWHSPRLIADERAGAASISFQYNHQSGATAVYSEKARRQQFMVGPHEASRWRLLEGAAHVIDFQFQPFTIVWTADGEERSYTPDTLELRRDGLVAVEVKADPAYFADADVADVLQEAEAFLSTKAVRLERRVGEADPLALRTSKDVADQRRFDFSDAEAARLGAALAADGCDVGDLVAAIGGHPAVAARKLRAMTARGLVVIPMDRPWTSRTPARAPAPIEHRHGLREFLLRHAPTRRSRGGRP